MSTPTDNTITFEQVGTTMMACPEALMEQEHRLLTILQGQVAFEISPDGALILTGSDSRKIQARQ
ncbi:META domain-containing protein [Paracoccus sp. SCSIO 75233]|uniref:META domain-containing protein n=1 Tax=Paracoccus sp. SCSIO 75233 TaxID=3017782 RepID=UPI0034A05B8F